MDTGPMTGPKSEMTYMESIDMMTKGAVFLKYRFSSNGKPQQRFVFYDKADGAMGSLYWCDPGKRKKDKDKCIPLHTVTGLFEENQTKSHSALNLTSPLHPSLLRVFLTRCVASGVLWYVQSVP
jgi:hypothetical protein